MGRWASKARAKGLGRKDALRSQLPQFKAEAARSPDDLQFAFNSEGVELASPPAPDETGLTTVETLYRAHYETLADRDLLERLMGLFLGEAAIALRGGGWVVYPGKYQVFSPFVVELNGGGRFVEPLLLCAGLANKPGLAGARDGAALIEFVRDLEARATI